MPVENSQSRQRSLRIRKAVDDWLQELGRKNPANRYGQVATEANAILEKAFAAAHVKSKRKK